MNPTLGLFVGTLRKQWILLKRYPVNTVGAIVGTYLFFLAAFLGGRALDPAALDDSLGGLIVGYFLATLAIAAYADATNRVTQETQWGTLEQLYMSPLGFSRVMFANAVATVAFAFVWGFSVLALMLLTTGESLSLDLLTVVPVGLLALASILGVGMALGGLAVLYKQVGQVTNLLQFGIFGLVAAPLTGHDAVFYLPLAQGSAMLQLAMREGVRLWEFPVADLLLLVAVAVGYLVAGFWLFLRATDRARRLGVLGDY